MASHLSGAGTGTAAQRDQGGGRRGPAGVARPLRSAAFGTLLLAAGLCAKEQQRQGELFDAVVEVLESRYHDVRFRQERLPILVEQFRPAAYGAADHGEERVIVRGLLAHMPDSHVALYSRSTYDALMADLRGEDMPAFGFALRQQASRFFVCALLEGGPGQGAGLFEGDQVMTIDGLHPGQSPWLDGRADDASLVDAPIYRLHAHDDAVLTLRVQRSPGTFRTLQVRAAATSPLRAMRQSAKVFEWNGLRLGHVHLHYIHSRGQVPLLRELLETTFAGCDGLVLDLRGRGGSLPMVFQLIRLLRGPRATLSVPLVVLVDRGTRSAKEILAAELQRLDRVKVVGERTAGAVIPASFVQVGELDVLMFPGSTVPRYTDSLEGVGVIPDVEAKAPGAFAGGVDPILDAGLRTLEAELGPVPR